MTRWKINNSELPFIVETCLAEDRPAEATKTEGMFVVLCLEGEGEIRVDNRKYRLVENSQMVLMPTVTVEPEVLSSDFRMLRLGCSQEIFEEITNSFEPAFFNFMKNSPCVVLPEREVTLLKQLSALTASAIADTGNVYRRQMACNYLQNILYHFYGRTRTLFPTAESKWVSRKEELFKDFLFLVHRFCSQQRDVSFYADRLNISSRYLSTIVMKASGETAKDIIARHVIAEIKVKLKSTRMNVQELSGEMNFVNPSFFCRYFKKHTGMSPLQFRNET